MNQVHQLASQSATGTPPMVLKALISVLTEMEAIEKSETNLQQNYKFRGIDQVYNELHGLFAKHRLINFPKVLETKREERTTQKGGTLLYTIVTVEYLIFHEDGSCITLGPVIGEGMDSGDKASNKALAAAHKYALMQMFLAPTEDQPDPDKETPPSSRPRAADRETKPAERETKAPAQDTPVKGREEFGKRLAALVQNDGARGRQFVSDMIITKNQVSTLDNNEARAFKCALAVASRVATEGGVLRADYRDVMGAWLKGHKLPWFNEMDSAARSTCLKLAIQGDKPAAPAAAQAGKKDDADPF